MIRSESSHGRVMPLPGSAAGYTLALAGFLPMMVIVSLAPAAPAITAHFAAIPHAATLIPLLITTPGLVVALLSPFAGTVIDRHGRRKPLLLATFLYAVFGMAPLLLSTLPAMFVARLGVGACEAFVLVAINALLADYFDADRRRFWLTVQGVGNPVLGAMMTALAGFLTSIAWNGAFFSYAAVLPVFAAIYVFCTEPVRVEAVLPTATVASPFPGKAVALVCAVTLFASTMFYVYIVQVGIALTAVGVSSPTEIGRDIAMTAIGLPAGALLFNILSRRIAQEMVMAVCLAFMGAGLTMIGLAHSAAEILFGGVVQQISGGMIFTSLVFWMSRILPPEHRGRGFGIWSTASFSGQFVSALLVGAGRGVLGGILPTFFALGLVTLGGASLLAVLARNPRLNPPH